VRELFNCSHNCRGRGDDSPLKAAPSCIVTGCPSFPSVGLLDFLPEQSRALLLPRKGKGLGWRGQAQKGSLSLEVAGDLRP